MYRKLAVSAVMFALLAMVSVSLAAPADAVAKKRIAIMNFEFGTVHHWWSGDWDIGKGIADMLVSKLVKDGTYLIIDRKALDKILAEQNLSNSDRTNPQTAIKIGKILSVNAIVTGSITEFGFENKNFNLGGGGGGWTGFALGKIGKNSGKAIVALDAQLIDTSTAAILASAQGKGESKRGGFSVGGGGGGGGGWGAGGVDMGTSNFTETIIGEATRAAVDQVATELINSAEKIEATKIEISGVVADVDGSNIILNVGKDEGVKAGDVFNVERVTRTVKDPTDPKKILRQITSVVGTVKITEVDAHSSTGMATGGPIKIGDVVKSSK